MLKLPDNPGICDALAQKYGALAFVPEHCCCVVSGKEIIIEGDKYSLMEHAQICNFNMHTSGAKPAVPTTDVLPGPVENTQTGQFNGV